MPTKAPILTLSADNLALWRDEIEHCTESVFLWRMPQPQIRGEPT